MEKILMLSCLERVGNVTITQAMEFFDGFETAPVEDILKFVQVLRRISLNEVDIEKAAIKKDKIIEDCNKNDVEIVTIGSAKYPNMLYRCDNPPAVLYMTGNTEALQKNKFYGVIGTRRPTIEGRERALSYSRVICENGIGVVSGLAAGCDTYAHTGALKTQGITLAVLPCGINNIYPESNQALAKQIIENSGILLSEYPPEEKAENYKFIARDRLQAALSKKMVVIETDVVGGTMHTVNFAMAHNKPIGVALYNNMNIRERAGNMALISNEYIGIRSIGSETDMKGFIEAL
ncbi:MAG: DNA-processing protein DprA [Eubacteriaceae bacterium]|nr:DNA-processing protein DprA [Eubacteriaceae bacterium]